MLGRLLGLRPEKVKALLPVGAAAAIAAAFNTPLAAVLFALEEIVGDLHAPVLGSVVLASATSWGVLRLSLGNSPLFKVPQYQLVHPTEFAAYAVLGVAGGLMSVAFTKLLLGMRARFLRLPQKTLWFQPLAGGIPSEAEGSSERKFVEKLRYIHRNPVKRGLVARPEDWAWSSFRHYLSGEAGPVETRVAVDGAEERASWDPPYGEGAPTRSKSPPKRSLDGPPSRVEMRVMGWATRPGEVFG